MKFTELVQMFYNEGLIAFGHVEDPVTEDFNINFHSGETALEIIKVLSQKTRGNLDNDEKEILETSINTLEKLKRESTTRGPSSGELS